MGNERQLSFLEASLKESPLGKHPRLVLTSTRTDKETHTEFCFEAQASEGYRCDAPIGRRGSLFCFVLWHPRPLGRIFSLKVIAKQRALVFAPHSAESEKYLHPMHDNVALGHSLREPLGRTT